MPLVALASTSQRPLQYLRGATKGSWGLSSLASRLWGVAPVCAPLASIPGYRAGSRGGALAVISLQPSSTSSVTHPHSHARLSPQRRLPRSTGSARSGRCIQVAVGLAVPSALVPGRCGPGNRPPNARSRAWALRAGPVPSVEADYCRVFLGDPLALVAAASSPLVSRRSCLGGVTARAVPPGIV